MAGHLEGARAWASQRGRGTTGREDGLGGRSDLLRSLRFAAGPAVFVSDEVIVSASRFVTCPFYLRHIQITGCDYFSAYRSRRLVYSTVIQNPKRQSDHGGHVARRDGRDGWLPTRAVVLRDARMY